jgi:hypothetical protein
LDRGTGHCLPSKKKKTEGKDRGNLWLVFLNMLRGLNLILQQSTVTKKKTIYEEDPYGLKHNLSALSPNTVTVRIML